MYIAAGGILSVGNESQQVAAAQEQGTCIGDRAYCRPKSKPLLVEYSQVPFPIGGGGDGDSFDGSTVDIGDAIATGAEQHVGNRSGRYWWFDLQ